MRIEPYNPHQLDAVIRLSLRAWTPVFDSIQKAIDLDVYRELYPDPDWRVSQQKAVEEVCADANTKVWVAMVEDPPFLRNAPRTAIDSGSTVGFVAVKLHSESRLGEIYMIAVDPDYQRRGIGSALMEFVLDWMKVAGMSVAMVETGGDPGHAPARYTYEKLGFGLLPIARYFKKL
ncbi:GNAT family N-acetyltransferase [Nostoc sp. CHAB 5715]|nr:GNAT family N-acetyltransferase [Nostoc sp. CHAB 5715]MCC5623200.1 GNAT family N-acetyltransferase [Nostoc sp. CHAB 5715]